VSAPGGPEQAAPTTVTFVLLPGAGGDSWYWHLVARDCVREATRSSPPDLPADDDAAGLGEHADAAEAIGERAGAIVVAQSLAALTAPMLCADSLAAVEHQDGTSEAGKADRSGGARTWPWPSMSTCSHLLVLADAVER
jgi:hypothetical protein